MIYTGDYSDSDYPVEAKRHGIEGYVLVNATVDEEGRVTYVQVVEQDPADESYRFAETATRVAKTIRFSNPRHQPTQVRFKVKFDLKDKHGTAPSGGSNGG
jgi:TonB family protein